MYGKNVIFLRNIITEILLIFLRNINDHLSTWKAVINYIHSKLITVRNDKKKITFKREVHWTWKKKKKLFFINKIDNQWNALPAIENDTFSYKTKMASKLCSDDGTKLAK